MDGQATAKRRPRFRRASTPPAFQLTEDDVHIVRQLARHRFLRSTHIALLVGRSLDRTNDRLSRLFHAGYVDRPRAQLDYYPSAGSGPMVYALADLGARLLVQRDGSNSSNVERTRKNREAGRPFIEHQLEIMDFYVALQCATRKRSDVSFIHPDELVTEFPDQSFDGHNPFTLRVMLSDRGITHQVGVVPDLAFGLRFPDGSRRCFMVEIDRGTMPILRTNIAQTSFERKMRAYLTAHAMGAHEQRFGWKTFRVLTITTDDHRTSSMMEALRHVYVPHSPGSRLFLFTTRGNLAAAEPLEQFWHDGTGRSFSLL